ncbi:7-cyano-7-deazaguanine synthase [Nitrososphaera sp.]|uniref:7-cyano-7-deazaguanine synthase n=1 Tax=Nitrososphaera sp. TaxID=1971748 RepID=UPI00307E3595
MTAEMEGALQAAGEENKKKKRKAADRALVMLSGGLDSATCLYWARSRNYETSAITFNYFGRLEKEKQAARLVAEKAGVHVTEVDLSFMKEAADFRGGDNNGSSSSSSNNNNNRDGRWDSYVPARNMIFYSIAAHYAEYAGVRWIVGGHNSHDVSFFKDASRGYIEKLNALFREGCLLCDGNNGAGAGTGRLQEPYQIVLPLADLDRKGVVELALELGVPIGQTWSCHGDGGSHCGRCYACVQRLKAFASLGLQDPVFPRGRA